MGKEFQKSALPTLFHFVRVRAALQPHVQNQLFFIGQPTSVEILPTSSAAAAVLNLPSAPANIIPNFSKTEEILEVENDQIVETAEDDEHEDSEEDEDDDDDDDEDEVCLSK